eukprot:5807042-Prymnesium_polylepis.1
MTSTPACIQGALSDQRRHLPPTAGANVDPSVQRVSQKSNTSAPRALLFRETRSLPRAHAIQAHAQHHATALQSETVRNRRASTTGRLHALGERPRTSNEPRSCMKTSSHTPGERERGGTEGQRRRGTESQRDLGDPRASTAVLTALRVGVSAVLTALQERSLRAAAPLLAGIAGRSAAAPA